MPAARSLISRGWSSVVMAVLLSFQFSLYRHETRDAKERGWDAAGRGGKWRCSFASPSLFDRTRSCFAPPLYFLAAPMRRAGACVFSRKPFLARRGMSFRYDMRPVPSVRRRFAFSPQLSNSRRKRSRTGEESATGAPKRTHNGTAAEPARDRAAVGIAAEMEQQGWVATGAAADGAS